MVFARVDNQRQSRNEFYLIQERYFRPKLNNVDLVVYVVKNTSKLEQNVISDIRRFFTFAISNDHWYVKLSTSKKGVFFYTATSF